MRAKIVLVRYFHVAVAIALGAALAVVEGQPAMAAVTFTTFVSGSNINATEGQDNTIGFTYAGNKFVGSVYFGGNNLQLFSTDLTGHNVQKFGNPLATGNGEVVLASSLGQAGFNKGDIYAGSQLDLNIYHFSNDGATQTLFATLPSGGDIRQIFFDPGSSFGGNMLVTTAGGDIFKVDSAGTPTLIASVGEDTEGMDIATTAWGGFAGDLLVSSENSGSLRLITPGGSVTTIATGISSVETVSFVPLDLGVSGNPLEGFYVANYPVDIQKAGAGQFAGLQGDAIITQEFGSNAPVSDLKYDPIHNTFSITQVGNLPNQSEDGIFVTAQRVNDLNPVPEPASIIVWMAIGGIAVVGRASRRRHQAA
jgi:hypothetical protein